MIRRNFIPQGGIVAVTLIAWFSISNHCALGAFGGTQRVAAHSSCHGSPPAPTKTPVKGEQLPCCKVLKALEAKTTTFVPNTFDFVLKEYLSGAVLSTVSDPHGLLIACDSGPPAHAFSFSESVLQRSILAHAPPCLI